MDVGSEERYVELSMGMEVPEEFVKNFVPIPKEYVEEAYRSDEYLVFIGPQHPGSGHMRIILRLKGDYIVMQYRTRATSIEVSRS